jgi:hypothetical protein
MNGLEDKQREVRDEPPPILSSWNRLYALVLASLAAYIILFYIVTRIFS